MSGTPPYAGNPGSFPLTVPLLDDSESTPDAAAFNPSIEGAMDRTAWLATRAALPIMNWQSAWLGTEINSAVATAGVSAGSAGCWDFWTQRFIAIVNEISNADNRTGVLYASYGLDGQRADFWTPMIAKLVTSGFAVAMGVAPDPTQVERYWVAYLDGVGALHIVWANLTDVAWTSARSVAGLGGASNSPWRGVELLGFGKYLIYAAGGADTFSTISSIDTTNLGGGWSDVAVGGNQLGFRLAAGGTLLGGVLTPMAIATPWGTYGQTSSPPSYWTTLDGVTWTPRLFSFVGLAECIGGLAWSAPLASWILAVNSAPDAGLFTRFYVSPDGIHWSLLKANASNFNDSGGPTGVQVTDLAALGPDLAISCIGVILPDTPTGAGGSIQYFSTNAGIDWWFAQANFPSNTTDASHWGLSTFAPAFVQPTRLVQAPHMLMALNAVWGRFSTQGATPPPAAS